MAETNVANEENKLQTTVNNWLAGKNNLFIAVNNVKNRKNKLFFARKNLQKEKNTLFFWKNKVEREKNNVLNRKPNLLFALLSFMKKPKKIVTPVYRVAFIHPGP